MASDTQKPLQTYKLMQVPVGTQWSRKQSLLSRRELQNGSPLRTSPVDRSIRGILVKLRDLPRRSRRHGARNNSGSLPYGLEKYPSATHLRMIAASADQWSATGRGITSNSLIVRPYDDGSLSTFLRDMFHRQSTGDHLSQNSKCIPQLTKKLVATN